MLSDEEDEDLADAAQLLPTHTNSGHAGVSPTKGVPKSRLGDVWDEGEELFDIGGESDEEGESHTPKLPFSTAPPHSPNPWDPSAAH